MLEIPGGPSKVGDCRSVAGEESHDIVKPLESGVFDGRLPSEVSVSRVTASVQEECTHVHTTAGRCIVEWGPPLFLHTREGEREREWRKSREEGKKEAEVVHVSCLVNNVLEPQSDFVQQTTQHT